MTDACMTPPSSPQRLQHRVDFTNAGVCVALPPLLSGRWHGSEVAGGSTTTARRIAQTCRRATV